MLLYSVQATTFLLLPAPVAAIVHSTLAGDLNGSLDRVALAGYPLTRCIRTAIAPNVRAAGGDGTMELLWGCPHCEYSWSIRHARLDSDSPAECNRIGAISTVKRKMVVLVTCTGYKNVFMQLGLSAFRSLMWNIY